MKPRPGFPELVVCWGVNIDGRAALIWTTTEEGPGQEFTVSVDDVAWVMPPIRVKLPDGPRGEWSEELLQALFGQSGLVLVACKVPAEGFWGADYGVVEVPAVSGPTQVTVKVENIALPYKRESPDS